MKTKHEIMSELIDKADSIYSHIEEIRQLKYYVTGLKYDHQDTAKSELMSKARNHEALLLEDVSEYTRLRAELSEAEKEPANSGDIDFDVIDLFIPFYTRVGNLCRKGHNSNGRKISLHDAFSLLGDIRQLFQQQKNQFASQSYIPPTDEQKEAKERSAVTWNDVKERYLEFHKMDSFTKNMAIDIDFGYWLVSQFASQSPKMPTEEEINTEEKAYYDRANREELEWRMVFSKQFKSQWLVGVEWLKSQLIK